jgi:hypothetical protein
MSRTSAMRAFSNRRKRVSRRMERDTFREVIMPAGYLCGGLGLLGILGILLHAGVTGVVWWEVAGLVLGLVVIPCAFQTYRLLRGHYSDELNEP